jgi:hypothetical protein
MIFGEEEGIRRRGRGRQWKGMGVDMIKICYAHI